MQFHATIERSGKTATGICIPDEVVAALGAGKRPAVRVTLNGHTYRSTVAVMGGRFMVGVSAQVREAAGVEGGDELDVGIALDTEPRQVTVPPDLQDALDHDPEAGQHFAALSYSNKRRLVLQIEGAKAAETRQRRIATTVSQLHESQP